MNDERRHPAATGHKVRDPETGNLQTVWSVPAAVAEYERRQRDKGGTVDGAATDGRVDGRPRLPAEIGEQLLRDAQSLELTGASFEKDEQFYRTVAANVREAANFLSRWQETIEALRASQSARLDRAIDAAYADCAGLAEQVRELVPQRVGDRPEAWRDAADAILAAILAIHPPSSALPRSESPEVRT